MKIFRNSLALCLAVFFILAGNAIADAAQAGKNHTTADKIRVELFVMSQCPFGVAAEKTLLPLVRKYGDKIDFSLHFIAQDEEMQKEIEKSGEPVTTGGGGCSGSPDKGVGPFFSLHGQPEVDEDLRQVAIARHYPKEYFNYLLCRADNFKDNEGWKKCAADTGIDAKRLADLMKAPETAEAFTASFQKAWGLGIGSSPTVLVNGKRYPGRVETMAINRYLCGINPGLQDCSKVPVCGNDDDCFVAGKEGVCLEPNTAKARCETAEPAKFPLTILTSKECNNYNIDSFKQITTHYFPLVTYRQVDIASAEGRAMASKYKVEFLPAMFFHKDLEKSIRFSRVKGAMIDKGDIYLMHPQASNSPCKLDQNGKVIRNDKTGQKTPATK